MTKIMGFLAKIIVGIAAQIITAFILFYLNAPELLVGGLSTLAYFAVVTFPSKDD